MVLENGFGAEKSREGKVGSHTQAGSANQIPAEVSILTFPTGIGSQGCDFNSSII